MNVTGAKEVVFVVFVDVKLVLVSVAEVVVVDETKVVVADEVVMMVVFTPHLPWLGECLFLFNFACGSSAWSYAWPIYWATCPSSKSMLKLEVGIKQNIMQTRQELITPTFEFPNFGFFFHPLRGILASQPA